MDKPISVGDLVAIVKPRPCCGTYGKYPTIYRVGYIGQTKTGTLLCSGCGTSRKALVMASISGVDVGNAIDRLKRIQPLDELEGQRTEESLKVPA